jgi:hypothetical protein
MPRMIARAFRVATIVCVVVALLWGTLIAGPMWLTRWRMSRLLADYHSIYPTQSSWADAQKLMVKWGKWGNYDGSCSANDCLYLITVSDEYNNWVDKLPEQQRERVWGSHLWDWLQHLGYRRSALSVQFQVQDGKIARTEAMLRISVADAGPLEQYSYMLGVTTQVRSRLASITRNGKRDPPWVLGDDDQLAFHPDYKVGRPSGCEGCEIDYITYAPTLPHEEAVKLTDFSLNCLTRLRACTTIGDLLPYGSGWHLYEDLPSTLRPDSSGGPLPCRTEPRALARDATVVVEVEVLGALSAFKPYPNDDTQQELARARILHTWKSPIREAPGATILVTPFAGEKAIPPYWPEEGPEHLLPGHRALLFLTEDGPTNFSPDSTKIGPVAYALGRCGVIDDTPANLSAVLRGIAEDIPYRHSLQNFGWW